MVLTLVRRITSNVSEHPRISMGYEVEIVSKIRLLSIQSVSLCRSKVCDDAEMAQCRQQMLHKPASGFQMIAQEHSVDRGETRWRGEVCLNR